MNFIKLTNDPSSWPENDQVWLSCSNGEVMKAYCYLATSGELIGFVEGDPGCFDVLKKATHWAPIEKPPMVDKTVKVWHHPYDAVQLKEGGWTFISDHPAHAAIQKKIVRTGSVLITEIEADGEFKTLELVISTVDLNNDLNRIAFPMPSFERALTTANDVLRWG